MNTDGLAEFHREMMVFDMHSDIPCEIIRRRSLGETEVLNNVFLDPLLKGGVDAFVVSIPANLFFYPSRRFSDHLEGGLNCIDVMYSDVEECSENFALVTDVKGIEQANKECKIAIVLGFEGGEPLGRELQNLRNFYRLGVRLIQLTWNYRNAIGDGVGERSGSEISPFGVEVIEEMNRLGMVVDLSHLNREGFFHALEVAEAPAIVSHGNSCGMLDHPRNFADDQIKAIADQGGLMGILALPARVAKKDATLEDLLKHLDHMIKLVGVEHVALGLDFVKYDGPRTLKDQHHPTEKLGLIKGLEEVEDLPKLIDGLSRHGYKEEEIKLILGGNYLRVLKTILPEQPVI